MALVPEDVRTLIQQQEVSELKRFSREGFSGSPLLKLCTVTVSPHGYATNSTQSYVCVRAHTKYKYKTWCVCVCECVCVNVCMHACTCVCMCMHACIRKNMYMDIYAQRMKSGAETGTWHTFRICMYI